MRMEKMPISGKGYGKGPIKTPMPVRPGPKRPKPGQLAPGGYKPGPKRPKPGQLGPGYQRPGPGPKRPKPGKLGPGGIAKPYNGGGVLDQLKKLSPSGKSARNQMKEGLVQGLNNLKSKKKLREAPKRALGNKLQDRYQAAPRGNNKGGGKLPNFKGVMQPRKKPITRPTPVRRGGR